MLEILINMIEQKIKIKPVSITWPRWTSLAAASAAVGRLPAHIRLRAEPRARSKPYSSHNITENIYKLFNIVTSIILFTLKALCVRVVRVKVTFSCYNFNNIRLF